MAFPARYKGTCKTCGKPIEVGQFITWSRREKGAAYHADCENPEAKPEPTATSPDLDAKIAELQALIDSATAKLGGTLVAKVDEAKASESTALVGESTALVASPKTPKLKDNALWFDLLQAICNNSDKQLMRVMLIGPPGTGKSKTSLLLTGTEYRMTMTEGMGVEDAIGMYQLIEGETVWCDGPIVRAMREGKRIVIDEIDHHPTEISSGLYGWLDDSPHATLPTGEIVYAKEGFGVIATTNSNVTALPEAVLDRFEAIMPAITPHPDAITSFENQSMKDAVSNHFKGLNVSPWQWSGKPTLRRMRAFAKLKPMVGETNAALLAFGSAGKEMLGVLTTASRTTGKL